MKGGFPFNKKRPLLGFSITALTVLCVFFIGTRTWAQQSKSVLNSSQLIVAEPAVGGGASLKVTGGTLTLKNSQNSAGLAGLTGGVSGVTVGIDGISTTINGSSAADNYVVTQLAVRKYVDDRITNIVNSMTSKVDKSNLVGMISPFGNASLPTGWLECNGQAVSRTQYALLFSLISTAFGAGDGSTTFNLPDLRGRTPIGQGQGTGLTNRTLGGTLGEETHALTINEMPAHTHDFRSYNADFNHAGAATEGSTKDDGDGTFTDTGAVQSRGGGQAHNVMQPSLVVKFYIRAEN